MADRKIVQVVSSFHVYNDGGPVSASSGDLYYADDPIVKGREHLFADVAIKESAKHGSRPERTSSTASKNESPEEKTTRRGGRRPASEEPKDEAKANAVTAEGKSEV